MIDLVGLKSIIRARIDELESHEYCCVFEDGRMEWHVVPKGHPVRKTWEQMVENKANEPAVEIIHDLEKWTGGDFL